MLNTQFFLQNRAHTSHPHPAFLGKFKHKIDAFTMKLWISYVILKQESSGRGSPRSRDQTCVSCIGKWILYPCATWKALFFQFSSVQFSRSVMSDSLRPHEPQHARPPCPSLTPVVHQNPCPLSQWCHPTISSSVVPFSSCLSIFPSIRVFSSESILCIRWPKYWSFSFSISPSNEYSGLISFRID